MATIKKAQNGTVKDSTKTYQDSPFQKAKQKNLKESEKQLQIQSVATSKKKMKMKNGGSLTGLKASNKRVGPVDPKGAWTKVQKKTLAGAKTTPKLTKDKQLGATKMSK